MYGALLGQSAAIDELFLKLKVIVTSELGFQKHLFELLGSLDAITAISNSAASSASESSALPPFARASSAGSPPTVAPTAAAVQSLASASNGVPQSQLKRKRADVDAQASNRSSHIKVVSSASRVTRDAITTVTHDSEEPEHKQSAVIAASIADDIVMSSASTSNASVSLQSNKEQSKTSRVTSPRVRSPSKASLESSSGSSATSSILNPAKKRKVNSSPS